MVTETEKALEYWRAVARKQHPRWVPARVRLVRVVRREGVFGCRCAQPGDYDCECNPQGAVIVTNGDGVRMALGLEEFEPLTWVEHY